MRMTRKGAQCLFVIVRPLADITKALHWLLLTGSRKYSPGDLKMGSTMPVKSLYRRQVPTVRELLTWAAGCQICQAIGSNVLAVVQREDLEGCARDAVSRRHPATQHHRAEAVAVS